jgi:hypothetical protein
MLMGAALILATIAPVSTFAEFEKLSGMFKNYTNSAQDEKEVLMKFFVWNLFQA